MIVLKNCNVKVTSGVLTGFAGRIQEFRDGAFLVAGESIGRQWFKPSELVQVFQKWEAMSEPERNAAVAEHVLGWRWIADGGDDPRYASLYEGDKVDGMLKTYCRLKHPGVADFRFYDSRDDLTGTPAYSTDAGHDYKVLKFFRELRAKLYEAHPDALLILFCKRLDELWETRDSAFGPMLTGHWKYEPGDYARIGYELVADLQRGVPLVALSEDFKPNPSLSPYPEANQW